MHRVLGALLGLDLQVGAPEESNAIHQHFVADTSHQYRHAHAERHQASDAQSRNQERGGKGRKATLNMEKKNRAQRKTKCDRTICVR